MQGVGHDVLAIALLPARDLDELPHEGRHVALQHGRVAGDHEVVVHLHLVVLPHDCGGDNITFMLGMLGMM